VRPLTPSTSARSATRARADPLLPLADDAHTLYTRLAGRDEASDRFSAYGVVLQLCERAPEAAFLDRPTFRRLFKVRRPPPRASSPQLRGARRSRSSACTAERYEATVLEDDAGRVHDGPPARVRPLEAPGPLRGEDLHRRLVAEGPASRPDACRCVGRLGRARRHQDRASSPSLLRPCPSLLAERR